MYIHKINKHNFLGGNKCNFVKKKNELMHDVIKTSLIKKDI